MCCINNRNLTEALWLIVQIILILFLMIPHCRVSATRFLV